MQHRLRAEAVSTGAETHSDAVAISVIVPSYNSAETIGRCLESLRKNTYPSFAVYVVDDCSTDDTAGIADSFGCNVLRTDRNRGPGHARNLGARHAQSPVLLFVDSDCEVRSNWIERYAATFAQHPEVACICSGYSESVTQSFWARFQFLDTIYNQQFTPEHPRWASSCNFGCRTDAFWSVGGFPEIYLNEDMEFFFFLSEKHRILWRADLGVVHHFHSMPSAYAKQQYGWGKSVVETYLKHPEIFFSPGTIAAGNISLQLVLLGLVGIGAGWGAFWNKASGAVIVLLSFLCVLLLNWPFFRFLKARAGLSFAGESMAAVIVRNTVWLLGMLHGAARYFYRWPGFVTHWARKARKKDLAGQGPMPLS